MSKLHLFLTVVPVLAAGVAYSSQASAQATNCSCGCASYSYYSPSVVGGAAGDVIAYADNGDLLSSVLQAVGFSYKHVAIQYDSQDYVTQATWNGVAPATQSNCAQPLEYQGQSGSLTNLSPGTQTTSVYAGSGVLLPSDGNAYCQMPSSGYNLAGFGQTGAGVQCANALYWYCGVPSQQENRNYWGQGYMELPANNETPYQLWSGSQENADWNYWGGATWSGGPSCPIIGGNCNSGPYWSYIAGDRTQVGAETLWSYVFGEAQQQGIPWYAGAACGGSSTVVEAGRAANQVVNTMLYNAPSQDYDYNTWAVGVSPTSTPDWIVHNARNGQSSLNINGGGYECSACNSCATTPTISCVENDSTDACGSVPGYGSYITIWGSNFGSANEVILDGYALQVTYNSATQINAEVNVSGLGSGYLYVYNETTGVESAGSYVTSTSSSGPSCSSGYTCAEYSSYCAARSCCSFGSWSCESDGCLYDTGCVY